MPDTHSLSNDKFGIIPDSSRDHELDIHTAIHIETRKLSLLLEEMFRRFTGAKVLAGSRRAGFRGILGPDN